MSQEETMIANLEEQMGQPLGHWLDALAASGLEKHGQLVKHLKSDHGFTHGYANLVAHLYRRRAEQADTSDDGLVGAQYEGKEALRPIYDRLVAAVEGFGKDVEIAPKKTYVSLRRSKQFGLIQPSTKTRVDVGLNLGDAPTTDRLEASGSFNSMVSHRVRVTDADQVDDRLLGWLREAYEGA